jgi:hypothetical protein
VGVTAHGWVRAGRIGQQPPPSGWAISPDLAVYEDGVQVGERGTFELGSTNGVTGYSHLEYFALDS